MITQSFYSLTNTGFIFVIDFASTTPKILNRRLQPLKIRRSSLSSEYWEYSPGNKHFCDVEFRCQGERVGGKDGNFGSEALRQKDGLGRG